MLFLRKWRTRDIKKTNDINSLYQKKGGNKIYECMTTWGFRNFPHQWSHTHVMQKLDFYSGWWQQTVWISWITFQYHKKRVLSDIIVCSERLTDIRVCWARWVKLTGAPSQSWGGGRKPTSLIFVWVMRENLLNTKSQIL